MAVGDAVGETVGDTVGVAVDFPKFQGLAVDVRMMIWMLSPTKVRLSTQGSGTAPAPVQAPIKTLALNISNAFGSVPAIEECRLNVTISGFSTLASGAVILT